MPKVSVLMPVYKTPEIFLKEAIESVLAQTFADFEFLILDDCPTDETCQKIISSYKDKRIKYSRNEINMGISGSRNKLVSMAEGEYIAVMDHDDVCMPDRFEKQVAFLDAHPKIGVLSARVEHFPKKKYPKDPLDNDTIEKTLFFHNCITHPACMMRKSILPAKPYLEELTPCEDYALWTGLIGKTKFATFPDILLRYRKHKTNTLSLLKKETENARRLIQTDLRMRLPLKWAEIQEQMTKIYRIWLLGFIPFLTIVKKEKKIKIFLFEKILCFSVNMKIRL